MSNKELNDFEQWMKNCAGDIPGEHKWTEITRNLHMLQATRGEASRLYIFFRLQESVYIRYNGLEMVDRAYVLNRCKEELAKSS